MENIHFGERILFRKKGEYLRVKKYILMIHVLVGVEKNISFVVKENKMMRWISLLLLLPLAVVAARNDKPVSLVVDDAPVAQVLQPWPK